MHRDGDRRTESYLGPWSLPVINEVQAGALGVEVDISAEGLHEFDSPGLPHRRPDARRYCPGTAPWITPSTT